MQDVLSMNAVRGCRAGGRRPRIESANEKSVESYNAEPEELTLPKRESSRPQLSPLFCQRLVFVRPFCLSRSQPLYLKTTPAIRNLWTCVVDHSLSFKNLSFLAGGWTHIKQARGSWANHDRDGRGMSPYIQAGLEGAGQ